MLVNPLQPANNKYKTTLCRHFSTTGTCTMGGRCHFAHGQEELRNANDPIEVYPGADPANIPQDLSGMGNATFKTIQCRYFELGICKYSEGCHFAHGAQDTKNAIDSGSMNQMALAQQYAALLQQQERLQGELLQQKETSQQSQQQTLQAPQQPSTPQYSVQKDPQVQREITTKQLEFILKEIVKQPLNSGEKFKANIAKQLLEAGNISGCSLSLNDIWTSLEEGSEKKKLIDKIISDASDLAFTLMAEFSVKIKEQQEALLQQQKQLLQSMESKNPQLQQQQQQMGAQNMGMYGIPY